MQLSITTLIIIITALVSIGGFGNRKIIDDLIFYPPAVSRNNQWYRFFSCGLIHADYGHLIFNMLSLYFFGPEVEKEFTRIFNESGKWLYLLMYVSALLISLLPTYFKNRDNYYYRSLGASGAVSTVIFAGLMLIPHAEVGILFIPIRIPGFIFAPLYILLSAYLERRGDTNINHSAHIWGAIYGLLFVIIAGKTVGYDAITEAINRIKYYLMMKGWIR